VYRIGERGEPWGVPQATGWLGVVACPRRTCTLLSVRNESTNRMAL
jgi:hypothetical protein